MRIPWKSSPESPTPMGGEGQHLSHPSNCLQRKLSCFCTGHGHTHTPTSGFCGFPYFLKTTFSPTNKDHLSCLSQAIETTGRVRGWGHWQRVACQWHSLWSGREARPSAKERFPGQEEGRTGWASPRAQEYKHSSGHFPGYTGFRSGKFAWRKTPGPSLLRGEELGEWHWTLLPHAGAEAIPWWGEPGRP